jgi:putative transposase
MKIIKNYKFKMYQSKKNKHLHRQIDIAGEIWNHCIALHRRYYRLHKKSLQKFPLMNHLAKLKKLTKYSRWKLLDAQAIQEIAERIDRSYLLFFLGLRGGEKSSPPKFKRISKYNSFTLKQASWKLLKGNKIIIRKRVYKFSKSREIPSGIKTVTVKRDNLGTMWLFFAVEEEINQNNQSMSGKIAGFDFGLKTFLTSSDNEQIESPLYYHEAMAELKRANRELSSKIKGSNNWHKAKDNVNRIYQKVVNKRRDWFFKLAHSLTDKYDYLFFEDLSMVGMQKLWGRKTNDLARSEFMTILKYIASTKGKTVHLVDRFYPSSKTCSDCGFIYKDLKLSERHWTCQGCGSIHDRDYNASVNIHREGASSLRLGDVSLSSESDCCLTLESCA